MIHPRLFRWRTTSLLVGSLVLQAWRVAAGPSVNVALQASFNAPPYIIELLSVSLKLFLEAHTDANVRVERPSPKRTQQHTFPYLTELPRGDLRNAAVMKTCIKPSSKWSKMTDISRRPMLYLPFDLPYRSMQPRRALRRNISTMTRLWSRP